MENLNQTNQIKEVSAETKGLPTIMERWDNLDAEIARVHELMDVRRFTLFQDLDQWQQNQGIEWDLGNIDNEHYLYLYNDGQNHHTQLVVTTPSRKHWENTRFKDPFYMLWAIRVEEIPVSEGADPRKVLEEIDQERTERLRWSAKREFEDAEKYGNEEEMGKWEQELEREVHKLKLENVSGTTIYRYNPDTIRKSNHKKAGGIVTYQMPGDPSVDLGDPSTIRTGYGNTTIRIEKWRAAMGGGGEFMYLPEFVRKWHEDPAKRIDPIDAGRRTLAMLQKAELLGRFDVGTGRVMQLVRLPETLEG